MLPLKRRKAAQTATPATSTGTSCTALTTLSAVSRGRLTIHDFIKSHFQSQPCINKRQVNTAYATDPGIGAGIADRIRSAA
jgi:hypothetical protein